MEEGNDPVLGEEDLPVLIRLLIGVSLLIAALLLWQGGGMRPPLAAPIEPPAATDPPEAGVLAGLPPEAVGRRVTEHAAEQSAQDAPALPPEQEAALGSVRGIVVDADAEPIADATVLLRRGSGVREMRSTVRSDANGLFHFPAVPAGEWQAGLLLERTRGRASATALQPVTVIAEQRTWVDLWLAGERAIRGRVLLAEEDAPEGLVYEVEARPLLAPDHVAADAVALPEDVEVFEPVPDRAELERRVREEYAAENPGAPAPARALVDEWTDALDVEMARTRVAEGAVFELAGLPPARYSLRIYLDVARECWAEFEADLSEVDAEFGLLRLRYEHFPQRAP